MTARVLFAAALMLVPALPAVAQTVSLSLNDGRVTLITQNATPAAILAEWARLGQVKVVDAERVPATPLTLRLENVPERQALDIVLRSAAGYIAAPRSQAGASSVSRFDRVIVMASSPGASTAAKPAAPVQRTASAPALTQPIVQATPAQEEEVAQAQPVVVEEASTGAATPEQPASATNFDYANPQRYFAARQAEQQAAEAAQQQQAQQPSTSPLGSLGQTTTRPGVVPTPQQQGTPAANGTTPANPYGLPAAQQPGSAPNASPLEPDRAKYINPYSPTPPRP